MNDNDRAQWIDNDEALYYAWRSSGQSKRDYIRTNRQELTRLIENTLNRDRKAHSGPSGHYLY